MRNLECLMPIMDPETGDFTFLGGDIVEVEVCFNYSEQVMPDLVEDCNFNVPCPVRYFPGPYGEVGPTLLVKFVADTGNQVLPLI